MDMRNGNMYPSREAAEQVGVPSESLVEVEPEIVVVTSGPFKGRRYLRTKTGLVRLKERLNENHPNFQESTSQD